MEQNSGTFLANPFYIFISLLLGALTFVGVRELWTLGLSASAMLLFILLLTHISMFWLNLRNFERPRWWMIYYPVQILLIVAIVNLPFANNINLTLLLTSSVLCLIGESLGVWGNTRRALYVGLSLFGFLLVMLYLLVEPEQFLFAAASILVNGGFIVLLMVMYNQRVAERQKAVDLAESLESVNAKLVASAARIETLTLQNERQRMARELHDTLTQGVAGLILQLEAAKAHLASKHNERAFAIVELAIVRARGTLAESRAAINDLRAMPDSITDSIRERVERFKQSAGIPCELELSVSENQLPAETTDQALQILSEALTNILRHAQATQVRVKFFIYKQTLELEVRDNGKGFDLNRQASGHYGLVGMHERARLTGGVLVIESNQSGTCVQFAVEKP
jgi:NarL family two-component system sensor histidine kinase YdfH